MDGDEIGGADEQVNDTGGVLIALGIIYTAAETYRTSRFAAPVVREANKYLGAKPKIWGIVLVAIGVLLLAVERNSN